MPGVHFTLGNYIGSSLGLKPSALLICFTEILGTVTSRKNSLSNFCVMLSRC